MNQGQKSSRSLIKNPAYREAFERLDEALVHRSGGSNFERIQMVRRALFGDVDKLQESETVKIPK
jgi:hypothetical protein